MQREACLRKLSELVTANAAELGRLETLAMGQPVALASQMAVAAAMMYSHFAGWADKLPGQAVTPEFGLADPTTRIIYHEPIGVCAGVVAWNATQALVAAKLGAAVISGNAIIIKSSEKSPLGVLMLGNLVKEAGFPPGVIQLLSGAGKTGQMLAEHMDIDKIAFTGSPGAGRAIQAASAKSNLKRVTLELGGKSPSLIFEDADIEKALNAMSADFLRNSGQICVAPSRLLVQESIKDTFVEQLKVKFQQAEQGYGDPLDTNTTLGPLADQKQYSRVLGILEEARQNGGGDVITGGDRWGKQGTFVQPTIFLNPGTDNTVWRDEVFGPVLAVRTFKTEEEAIAVANDTHYGLAAAVFTKDVARALRVSQALEAGNIGVNQTVGLSINTPFGGYKTSGTGRELGRDGIMMYMHSKTVSMNMVS
jgi:aldehyde dehydrogenase (NAD+)